MPDNLTTVEDLIHDEEGLGVEKTPDYSGVMDRGWFPHGWPGVEDSTPAW